MDALTAHPPASPSRRTAAHKPALAVFAACAGTWVFVLVTLGAFTTSIGAGMAFPDWPLSNGSLNPHGWLHNLAMFAEHAHRLSAGVMSTLTAILAVWIWVTEARAWLRTVAVFAFGLILVQALVGGLRVLLDPIALPSLGTNAGQLFAMLHAWLGQVLACVLLAIAFACSRGWIERARPVGNGVRRLGLACCILLAINLVIASVVRHTFAGLAIPTFPGSTPDGGLLPAVWSFRVGIHFAHRVMAGILAISLTGYAIAIWRDRGTTPGMRAGAAGLIALLLLQVTLGGAIILTLRSPGVTTGHVVVGALTLATTACLTWLAYRDRIEQGHPA